MRLYFTKEVLPGTGESVNAIKQWGAVMLPKKQPPGKPIETPLPGKTPETVPSFDPEEPVIPEEDPDIIPDEDPFETPPYEVPPPAEGP